MVCPSFDQGLFTCIAIISALASGFQMWNEVKACRGKGFFPANHLAAMYCATACVLSIVLLMGVPVSNRHLDDESGGLCLSQAILFQFLVNMMVLQWFTLCIVLHQIICLKRTLAQINPTIKKVFVLGIVGAVGVSIIIGVGGKFGRADDFPFCWISSDQTFNEVLWQYSLLHSIMSIVLVLGLIQGFEMARTLFREKKIEDNRQQEVAEAAIRRRFNVGGNSNQANSVWARFMALLTLFVIFFFLVFSISFAGIVVEVLEVKEAVERPAWLCTLHNSLVASLGMLVAAAFRAREGRSGCWAATKFLCISLASGCCFPCLVCWMHIEKQFLGYRHKRDNASMGHHLNLNLNNSSSGPYVPPRTVDDDESSTPYKPTAHTVSQGGQLQAKSMGHTPFFHSYRSAPSMLRDKEDSLDQAGFEMSEQPAGGVVNPIYEVNDQGVGVYTPPPVPQQPGHHRARSLTDPSGVSIQSMSLSSSRGGSSAKTKKSKRRASAVGNGGGDATHETSPQAAEWLPASKTAAKEVDMATEDEALVLDDAGAVSVVWQWKSKSNGGNWKSYTRAESKLIEHSYLAGNEMVLLSQQSGSKRINSGGSGNRIYSVHFDFMVQRTVKTRGTGSLEKSKMRAMIAPVKHRRVRRVDVKDLKLSDSGDVFEDRTTRFRSSMQTRNDTQHTQREQTVYNRPSSRINRNKNLPSAYGESAVSAISVPPENMPEMRARHDNAFGKYTGDLLQSASSRLMQEIQAAGFEEQQDLMQHFMASPRNSLRKNAGGFGGLRGSLPQSSHADGTFQSSHADGTFQNSLLRSSIPEMDNEDFSEPYTSSSEEDDLYDDDEHDNLTLDEKLEEARKRWEKMMDTMKEEDERASTGSEDYVSDTQTPNGGNFF